MTIQDNISSLSENQDVKVCSKCGNTLLATPEFFSRDKSKKSGIRSVCKVCEKKYREKNSARIRKYKKEHSKQISEQGKKYRAVNAKKIKEYLSGNIEKTKKRYKKYKKKKALHRIYAGRLDKYEDIRKTKSGGFIEVKCAYCGAWIVPTNMQAYNRYKAILGDKEGESRFYCNNSKNGANGCREACPIYNRYLYPAGFKPATSREVDPYTRQTCMLRDNYTCQHCGATKDNAQLHCHHIIGVAHFPMVQNDVCNTVTLCRDCHKSVHKTPGCGYQDYKCA